ncbi:IS30 family transposase [Paenibacillus pasadenensis]|uniref:IS30 family transposase n=1 Tax=Paenibacillus pasadenensis TaxID=217090 RepID=UPI00203DCFBA|nr:IS30 family transposase [Paenibacillus pasadenensis]MCM3749281.1 IS30 family transposase [Paenibacillus pasadenensis]
MSYTHITLIERAKLEVMRKKGLSIWEIARELERSGSTVSRELKRGMNTAKSYEAGQAHALYKTRRRASQPKGSYTEALARDISEKLYETLSPEQIEARIKAEGTFIICFKTIYRWIYQGRIVRKDLSLLRHKGKRHEPAETRGKFAMGTSIHERPEEVEGRTTFGHWELDTVVSGRGTSKACVATFVERKTRMYIGVRMVDRSASSMEQAVKRSRRSLSERHV